MIDCGKSAESQVICPVEPSIVLWMLHSIRPVVLLFEVGYNLILGAFILLRWCHSVNLSINYLSLSLNPVVNLSHHGLHFLRVDRALLAEKHLLLLVQFLQLIKRICHSLTKISLAASEHFCHR